MRRISAMPRDRTNTWQTRDEGFSRGARCRATGRPPGSRNSSGASRAFTYIISTRQLVASICATAGVGCLRMFCLCITHALCAGSPTPFPPDTLEKCQIWYPSSCYMSLPLPHAHQPYWRAGLPLDAFNHHIFSLAARDRTGIDLAQDRLRPEHTSRAT
jgi:hypothetical protein